MSIYVDTCDEQYLSIWQLLRLLIQVDADGNLYINTSDSSFNPDNLQQFHCDEQYSFNAILKQLVIEDSEGNAAVQFCSTDNAGICNLRLDFEHACNSQYLTLI